MLKALVIHSSWISSHGILLIGLSHKKCGFFVAYTTGHSIGLHSKDFALHMEVLMDHELRHTICVAITGWIGVCFTVLMLSSELGFAMSFM